MQLNKANIANKYFDRKFTIDLKDKLLIWSGITEEVNRVSNIKWDIYHYSSEVIDASEQS